VITVEMKALSPSLWPLDWLASQVAIPLHVVCYQVGLRALSPGPGFLSPEGQLATEQDLKVLIQGGGVMGSLGCPPPMQISELCLFPLASNKHRRKT
jgi:hypothetical protein